VPNLFSPISLRELVLANRVVVSPMCQYSATEGSANDWHVVNLGHYALSGPGLVFFEATHVSPEGRITPRCLGLYDDENEAGMQRVVQFLRRWTKSAIGVQLAHAGRKGGRQVPWEGDGHYEGPGAWTPVAPSAVPFQEGWRTPHALDADGMQKVRDDFVAAAQRSQRLGLDTIELHFAHGYLAHQFLSPLSNRRTGRYGGSLENRMRFPLELFDAVRAVWPAAKPLGVRVSATDHVRGGWDLEQTIALAKELATRGCDYIDTSSGGLSPLQKIDSKPGYQVPYARAVRRASGVPTIAVGAITDPHHAEKIVARGDADMVALARGFIRDPRWTWSAADALGGVSFVPPEYLRGRKSPHG
jgi:NADPH2 dehydrogenase